MSREVAVSFGAVAGTGAGLGSTGRFSLLADRPEGVAGGTGLGFNGGELLALAIGGCFWNDLHYAADHVGVPLEVRGLDVAVTLAGMPLRAVRARVAVRLAGAAEDRLQAVFEAARETTTVANSVAAAVPVHFERE